MAIGRTVIYTDVPTITYENVIDVLREAIPVHTKNSLEMEFLDNYEKGCQPIMRKKKFRPDIDIKVTDNIANEITEFKTAFQWGNPITLIQKSKESTEALTNAIAILNQGYETENIRSKTQHLARNIEITGRGYTYVDINLDEGDIAEGGSYFKLESLDVLTTFVIKSSYYEDERVMLGVTFKKDFDGIIRYTAFTKDTRYEIKEYKHTARSGEKNPLGRIPIIEWLRNYDNMGCFERQIPEMDNLNLLISDFSNDVDQNTQAIWHGNDIAFPKEVITKEDGTTEKVEKKPQSHGWLITQTTPDGKTPFVKALAVDYDYSGMLNNILTRRALILEKCNVPQRNDNSGGSTGLAMDSATGWTAAESQAQKQQNIMESCKMEEVKVVLRAVKNNPYLPSDSPLLKLKYSDIQPNIKRSKTYELTVKTNAICALLSHGFDLRDCMQAVPIFDDNTQVLERSGKGVALYQEKVVFSDEKSEKEEKRPFPDYSDQMSQSPNIK